MPVIRLLGVTTPKAKGFATATSTSNDQAIDLRSQAQTLSMDLEMVVGVVLARELIDSRA